MNLRPRPSKKRSRLPKNQADKNTTIACEVARDRSGRWGSLSFSCVTFTLVLLWGSSWRLNSLSESTGDAFCFAFLEAVGGLCEAVCRQNIAWMPSGRVEICSMNVGDSAPNWYTLSVTGYLLNVCKLRYLLYFGAYHVIGEVVLSCLATRLLSSGVHSCEEVSSHVSRSFSENRITGCRSFNHAKSSHALFVTIAKDQTSLSKPGNYQLRLEVDRRPILPATIARS